MRIDGGVPQAKRDQLFELLGEHVLEHLGLGVDPIPGHPQLLGEEQLDQPVMAQNLEREAATVGGQADTVVGLVFDQAELGQLAHHPRDRAGSDAEPVGQVVGGNR